MMDYNHNPGQYARKSEFALRLAVTLKLYKLKQWLSASDETRLPLIARFELKCHVSKSENRRVATSRPERAEKK
jgi:hypothetical protein